MLNGESERPALSVQGLTKRFGDRVAFQDASFEIAFVTGSMGTHDRGLRLENTVRDCLGVPTLGGS